MVHPEARSGVCSADGGRSKGDQSFGDNRQKYNARTLVAEFFGVTEYEIRKAVKLTYLIPELADLLETNPKQLNLACTDLIADYDAESQQAFIEICSIIGAPVNKATIQHIVRRCPPPTAEKQHIFEAYREARRTAEKHLAALPRKYPLTAGSMLHIWTSWTVIRNWKIYSWSFCESG